MLHSDVAPGIHRIEDAHTNWYVVEDGRALTIIDTGFPRSWRSLQSALTRIKRSLGDVEAVVLTHAHFDHMGFVLRAQRELRVPVFAHEAERPVVAHPWRYEHERSRIPYLRHPKFTAIFAEMTAMGALWVKGTDSMTAYEAGQRLDVPGHPQVLPTPGHTHGHCSLFLADRGALIVGDAFVMLDPYTGRQGPCIVAGAATADSSAALASLQQLTAVDAELALTGHGEPWRGSMAEAVSRAREAGPA